MSDSKLLIVVEGQTDAKAIRAVLGEELSKRTRIFAARGRISLVTVARNLLFHEGGPVLVVMDADTTNPHLVEEQKAMARVALESLLPGAIGERDGLVRVFAFVPEIEVLFFEAPKALERLIGDPVPEESIQEGLLIPKKTLARLFQENVSMPTMDALYANLADAEIAKLISQGEQASALKETVRSMVSPAVPTA
jgi:hypothetical protein